ncbi:MAG: hypothetical protein NVS4B3_26400 [Gemmatimonadaceae bacterium]
MAFLLCCVTASLPAQANHPQIREGVNVSFGLGAGSAALNCGGCSTNRVNGTAIYLNVGGTINPQATLGAELSGWSTGLPDGDYRIGSILLVGHYYPRVDNGAFISAGIGTVAAEAIPKGAFDAKVQAVGSQLGFGYDVAIEPHLFLTPYIQYVRAFNSEITVNGAAAGPRFDPNLFQFGLGFTRH